MPERFRLERTLQDTILFCLVKIPFKKFEPLKRSEWAFESISESERRACLYYECARYSDLICDLVSLWKTHVPPADTFPFNTVTAAVLFLGKLKLTETERSLLSALARSDFRIALALTAFPKPWQEVDQSERGAAMKLVKWEPSQLPKPIKPRNFSKIQIQDNFQCIDWGYSNKYHMEKYKKWLRANRPCPRDEFKRGRVERPKDLLRKLGLLRLSNYAQKVAGSKMHIDLVSDGEVQIDERCIPRARKKIKDFIEPKEASFKELLCLDQIN